MNSHLPTDLPTAFLANVDADPDAVALTVDEIAWSRGDLADLAGRSSTSLRANGLRSGDVIVIQYAAEAEDMALALAALAEGATIVPVPTRLGPRDVRLVAERIGARLVVVHEKEDLEQFESLQSSRTLLRADVIGAPLEPLRVAAQPGQPAVIGLTSGSTGTPKGVVHGWPSMAWAADHVSGLVDLQPNEPILLTGAGAGAPGFTFFTYLGLRGGHPIVRAGKWEPPRVLSLLAKHGCAWTMMVTTMLYMLVEEAKLRGGYPLPELRAATVGGAPISAELVRDARDLLEIEVLRMYAMSECMAQCSMRLTDSVEARDVKDGRPGPGAEIAVFDAAGRPLPSGRTGEIGMRGPALFEGYAAEPGAKQDRTIDGYFLSGDLGSIDRDGFLTVEGRLKDLIIRGGYNIDPVEIEEALTVHPAVRLAVVVGVADDRLGERACAVIQPEDGQDLTFDEMVTHLLDVGLSKEKLPERLVTSAKLPTLPDGKLSKGLVREVVNEHPHVSNVPELASLAAESRRPADN